MTTGRLTGGASVQAQSYRASERRHGRPDFEVWDRERLLEWLADSPEAGLAGSSDGPVLALAGAIDEGTVTLATLERRGRAWLPAAPGSLQEATDLATEVTARQRRSAVEAAVLGNRLRRSGRSDLAAMTALLLLRSAWCHALSGPGEPQAARPDTARAAIHMFAGYALDLLDQVEPVAKDPRALLDAVSATAFPHVAYPAACVRLAEILGLLGLLADGPADDAGLSGLPAGRISRTVADLLEYQPGCHHPVSDGFAVSLIAPVLLTAGHAAGAARRHLCRTVAWTADRYDPQFGGVGLAATTADPEEEVAWLLGASFSNGPQRRPWSYVATVVTDLAAIIPGSISLYEDVVNDFLAVDASPVILQADERRAQWRPDGPGGTLTAGVAYADPLPSDGTAAQHFTAQSPPVPPWDALALAGVTRNRHVVQTLRDNLPQAATQA